jgi:hypothetical protein
VKTLLVAMLAVPFAAHAFSIESVATVGCHEQVTGRAQASAGWPEGAAPGPADRAVTESLAFTVPAGADAWTVALLIGVRDNDLHGASPSEFVELSALHNAADGQEEHCLRAPTDDGDEGARRAVAACRDFIAGQLEQALGEGDVVDFQATDTLLVGLRYQQAALTLPRYPLHLGRALHALQDSFTHTLRGEDEYAITTVFNYAEPAISSSYEPERDGLKHRSDFDSCAPVPGRQAARVEAATTASAQLIEALGRSGTRTDRLARANALLDRWLSVEAGCTSADAFCGTEEPEPQGCSTIAGGPMLLLSLIALRRRSRTRPSALGTRPCLYGEAVAGQKPEFGAHALKYSCGCPVLSAQ